MTKRLNQIFQDRMEVEAAAAEEHRPHNAALASNLYRQALRNVAKALGGRQVQLNGIPPRVVFPDYSYLNMSLPS